MVRFLATKMRAIAAGGVRLERGAACVRQKTIVGGWIIPAGTKPSGLPACTQEPVSDLQTLRSRDHV
jgi:hypothetical protein